MANVSKRVRYRKHGAYRLLRFLFLLILIPFLILVLTILAMRWLPVPTTSFMLQSKTPVNYQWIGWDKVSDEVKLAVIAGEDQRFPSHPGLDLEEIKKALDSKEAKLRGASTISQQVSKNLFLWGGRSYTRKALEGGITLVIETLWNKQRILEVYLNIAQFGDGIYGVEAASWHYFDIPAALLNRRQASLLAAVLPNPVIYSVKKPQAWVKNRQRWILKQMSQLGGLTYLEQIKPVAE
jgi:monofunctional biosynthetic peptidoglycan transglycosylase